jgi:hypothetical protein
MQRSKCTAQSLAYLYTRLSVCSPSVRVRMEAERQGEPTSSGRGGEDGDFDAPGRPDRLLRKAEGTYNTLT